MTDNKTALRKQAEEKASHLPEDLGTLSPEEIRQTLHELRVHQIELEMQNEELHQSQAELEAARARYFDLYDQAPVGYVTLGEQGLILEANFTAATLLGATRGYLVQQPLSRFILKQDRDIFYRLRKQLFDIAAASPLGLHPEQAGQAGALQAYELRMLKKDGTTFWAHLEAAVQCPAAGEAQAGTPELRIVMSDITKRKQVEEALGESEEKYRNIFQNAAIGIFQSLPEGRFLRVNPALAQMMGYVSPEEMISTITDIRTQTYVDPKKRADNIAAAMADAGWVSAENRYRRKDGTIMIADLTLRKVLHPDGTVAYFEGFVIDITAHKHLEEELLRTRNLESLGVLAGGIAHDFNNLLGIVQGYIDLVLTDLPPGHLSRQLLLSATHSVAQTRDLTTRLITFSRGGWPIKEIFDVPEIIREAVQRTVKGTKVRVNFDFRDDLWPAEVDDLQMKQVFNNLAKNAVEATPEGGMLTIQALNALLPAGGALDLPAGAYLKITFTDEGIGIPEDHLAKIFDPYFSTKRLAAQNGLGLGLAVCYSVLKSHDGHITVQSLPGKGASFVIYIPARPELAKEKAREKEVKKTTSTASRVGPVRVLIMDDDSQARGLMRAFLERMDYEVTEVQHGQEAIDAYREALEAETPFDLALLDLKVRQGMRADETMKRLLKIAPALKAIIVSGYVDDPVMLNYADYGFQGALRKPFQRADMKSLVERVLHE